ncbi:MAG: hypothetical protein JSS27_00990 [Planctomycetes bacterium]|nr:hypothetical protein [Planctomycetota bacterium]
MQSARFEGFDAVNEALLTVGRKANKVLRKELRETTKQAAALVKPMIPRGETKFLSRSLRVRVVKSKKRFDVAFRIVAKATKEGKYYAFAPNYGVSVPRGRQAANRFMQRGIEQAESLVPDTLNRVLAGILELK